MGKAKCNSVNFHLTSYILKLARVSSQVGILLELYSFLLGKKRVSYHYTRRLKSFIEFLSFSMTNATIDDACCGELSSGYIGCLLRRSKNINRDWIYIIVPITLVWHVKGVWLKKRISAFFGNDWASMTCPATPRVSAWFLSSAKYLFSIFSLLCLLFVCCWAKNFVGTRKNCWVFWFWTFVKGFEIDCDLCLSKVFASFAVFAVRLPQTVARTLRPGSNANRPLL